MHHSGISTVVPSLGTECRSLNGTSVTLHLVPGLQALGVTVENLPSRLVGMSASSINRCVFAVLAPGASCETQDHCPLALVDSS